MSLKICEKCGEEVDVAKAFCPDCGSPFVEEKIRESSSEFDKYAGTVNFSQSVYKMMLSEMDLDTSKPSDKKKEPQPVKQSKNKQTPESISPKNIQPKVVPPKKTQPEVVSSKNVSTETKPANKNKGTGTNKKVVAGVVGLVILIMLAIGLLLGLLYSFYIA